MFPMVAAVRSVAVGPAVGVTSTRPATLGRVMPRMPENAVDGAVSHRTNADHREDAGSLHCACSAGDAGPQSRDGLPCTRVLFL